MLPGANILIKYSAYVNGISLLELCHAEIETNKFVCMRVAEAKINCNMSVSL